MNKDILTLSLKTTVIFVLGVIMGNLFFFKSINVTNIIIMSLTFFIFNFLINFRIKK